MTKQDDLDYCIFGALRAPKVRILLDSDVSIEVPAQAHLIF